MKTLLFFVFVAPLTSWAQVQLQPQVARPIVPTVQQAFKGPSTRFLDIPTGRFFYRNLRDTVGNHYASPLPAGEWQLRIIRFISPHWLAVRWLPGSLSYAAGDTATYYLPRAGAQIGFHI